MENSVDQIEYKKFMDSYEDDVRESEYGRDTFYAYGPLSEKYWQEKPRVLVCNLEPYDEKEGTVTVDINLFKEWIGANTCKFAAKFVHGLFLSLEDGEQIKPESFKHYKVEELFLSLEKIAYMNFRNSSGILIKADIKSILSEVEELKDYLRDQIRLLNPDIIIVGGEVGCIAINKLLGINLIYNSNTLYNKKIVYSIKHFSRADYSIYSDKIDKITAQYNNMKLGSS